MPLFLLNPPVHVVCGIQDKSQSISIQKMQKINQIWSKRCVDNFEAPNLSKPLDHRWSADRLQLSHDAWLAMKLVPILVGGKLRSLVHRAWHMCQVQWLIKTPVDWWFYGVMLSNLLGTTTIHSWKSADQPHCSGVEVWSWFLRNTTTKTHGNLLEYHGNLRDAYPIARKEMILTDTRMNWPKTSQKKPYPFLQKLSFCELSMSQRSSPDC